MASSTTQAAVDDYRALRERAHALDLSPWTVLRLHGPDTRSFLQGLATQDLERDRPGGAQTFFLNEKGRPVTLAWVCFEAAGDSAWIVADEGARESLRPHFERFRIMEDVDWEGPDGVPCLVGMAGPERGGLLEETVRSHPGVVIAASPLSFLLLPTSTPQPRPAHRDAFEAWRLSVGFPRTGVDFDAARIVTELELPEAISLTKGCYVGQEVVARTSRGHVRRRRIGFRFEWPGSPLAPGSEIRVRGAASGFVTSTAREPGSGEGLGMGYLSTELGDLEPEAAVTQGAKTIRLRIGPWPL